MATNFSLFNLQWYLDNNPDVAEAVRQGLIDAEEHFNQHGKAEGRSPGPLFNLDQYLLNNPDVADAVARGETTAYDHFMQFGAGEGRSPINMFDEAFYLSQNPDVAAAVAAGLTSAIEHFLAYGQGEPRAFNPAIDLGAYLNANPDVAAAAAQGLISPLEHLMMHGVSEGRDLGNGVNLGMFGDDPVFQQALESGDLDAALDRVSDVAPFIPSFETPSGWTPPADLPIPTDFVPPEGLKLVIPEGVEVPEGTELPDTFEPATPGTPGGGGGGGGGATDTVTKTVGELSGLAIDTVGSNKMMWVGSGNSVDNFAIARTAQSQLELALKGYIRGTGDTDPIAVSALPIYEFGPTARAGFAYSLAALDGKTLAAKMDEGYDFFLKIDTDASSSTRYVTLKLGKDTVFGETQKEDDSGYRWVKEGDETILIVDDEGGDGKASADSLAFVTQNIQTPIWYGSELEIGNSGVLKGGVYDIVLQAVKDNSVIVEQTIQLDVEPLSINYQKLSDVALKDDNTTMLNGTGNLGSSFAVHQIKVDGLGEPDLEIALGGQVRQGSILIPDANGVIKVDSGQIPVFKFSIASLNEASLESVLANYDIKLLVDTDKTSETSFIELKAVTSTDNGSGAGAFDWVFPDAYGTYRLIDDQGNANVSQNIQALGWYQPVDNELFKTTDIAAGQYTVAIQVHRKDSIELVGATEVTFDIAALRLPG